MTSKLKLNRYEEDIYRSCADTTNLQRFKNSSLRSGLLFVLVFGILTFKMQLNIWIIGSLSDQYQYVVKGKVKSKRKSLLILNLVNMLIALLMIGICIFMVVELVTSSIYGVSEEELLSVAMGSLFAILGLLLPLCGVAIATAVLRYMALYDIYSSTDPGNSVLFTVLSILFSVTEPFFLFFNRDKDNGMPPKKPAPQQYPQEPVYGIREDNKDYL